MKTNPLRTSQALVLAAAILPALGPAAATTGTTERIVCDPYVGAIVVDNASGKAIFADNANAKAYPASTLKLMNLLIILEKIKEGVLHMEDEVTVTAETSKIGGTQVWLKENETFTIDELLYALIVRSANDAAAALAIHIAGSKDAFVDLMNQRALALGMKSTRFHSVHGLPPDPGQEPDVTTARDMAVLARELLKHPDTIRYTSTRERGFRNDSVIMRSHNPLVGTFKGCDGLKTGYFSAAGFSIVATAKRDNVRVIAVVLGSATKDVRDTKAAELLAKGFLVLPQKKVE